MFGQLSPETGGGNLAILVGSLVVGMIYFLFVKLPQGSSDHPEDREREVAIQWRQRTPSTRSNVARQQMVPRWAYALIYQRRPRPRESRTASALEDS